MHGRYFTDEELVAYLDGEEDYAPTEEIAYALKRNPELVRRVDDLRVDTGLIANSFAALQTNFDLKPKLPETTKIGSRPLQFVAAAMIALVIGFGAGFLTPKSGPSDWKDYVAAYQALYTNGTLASVSQSDLSKEKELARVVAAIGKEIKLAKLAVAPEVEYKRAQVLGFKGKALIQLAFLSSTGQPMALCIIRTGTKNAKDIRLGEMEGLSSASWSHEGYEFLLIGGTDLPLTSRIAAKFQSANL